ncbi:MAG: ribosomal protein S18-alanine N-acetyltransferase [Thermoanaerobaculia bacterium]
MPDSTRSAPPVPRGITIREARRGDLPAVVTLERASFDDPWSERLLDAELAHRSSLALLATGEGGTVLGYAAFRRAADQAELVRIAVAPEARSHGVGRRLVEEGVERLRRGGVRRCFLEVRTGNAAARKLYAGLGFRRFGLRRAYYADGSDALVLALRLTPPAAGSSS